MCVDGWLHRRVVVDGNLFVPGEPWLRHAALPLGAGRFASDCRARSVPRNQSAHDDLRGRDDAVEGILVSPQPPTENINLPMTFYLKLRGFSVAATNILMNAIAFLVVKFFPIVMLKFNLYTCMGILATNCAVGVFFIVTAIEETMGKDLDADLDDDNVEHRDIENDVSNQKRF